MIMDLAVQQVVFYPFLFLIAAAFSLSLMEKFYTFASAVAVRSHPNDLVKSFKPAFVYFKQGFEFLFGKSFKFNFTHVCLVAVIIALVGVYNAIEKSNQLREKQLKAKKKNN